MACESVHAGEKSHTTRTIIPSFSRTLVPRFFFSSIPESTVGRHVGLSSLLNRSPLPLPRARALSLLLVTSHYKQTLHPHTFSSLPHFTVEVATTTHYRDTSLLSTIPLSHPLSPITVSGSSSAVRSSFSSSESRTSSILS